MHDNEERRYGLVEFTDGRVTSRKTFTSAEKEEVERYLSDFRGSVYVDQRKDSSLLSLQVASDTQEVDFATFRRAKSDAELRALQSLTDRTFDALHSTGEPLSRGTFRGAEDAKGGMKSAFQKRKTAGFTEFRAGFQDKYGRCSELTRIEPLTEEWRSKMKRVYRGLAAVSERAESGAKVKDLEQVFLSHLDHSKDFVYGSVLHHTGYRGHEDDVPIDVLKDYDFLTIGAHVGDKNNNIATVYTSSKAVLPREEEKSSPYRGPKEDAWNTLKEMYEAVVSELVTMRKKERKDRNAIAAHNTNMSTATEYLQSTTDETLYAKILIDGTNYRFPTLKQLQEWADNPPLFQNQFKLALSNLWDHVRNYSEKATVRDHAAQLMGVTQEEWQSSYSEGSGDSPSLSNRSSSYSDDSDSSGEWYSDDSDRSGESNLMTDRADTLNKRTLEAEARLAALAEERAARPGGANEHNNGSISLRTTAAEKAAWSEAKERVAESEARAAEAEAEAARLKAIRERQAAEAAAAGAVPATSSAGAVSDSDSRLAALESTIRSLRNPAPDLASNPRLKAEAQSHVDAGTQDGYHRAKPVRTRPSLPPDPVGDALKRRKEFAREAHFPKSP